MPGIALEVSLNIEGRKETHVVRLRSQMIRSLPSVGDTIVLEAPRLRRHRGEDDVKQRLKVVELVWTADLESVTVHLTPTAQWQDPDFAAVHWNRIA